MDNIISDFSVLVLFIHICWGYKYVNLGLDFGEYIRKWGVHFGIQRQLSG